MRTNDGVELRATVPDKILEELHKMSRAPAASDREFAYQMAGRVLTTTGKRIRPWPPEDFITDLVDAGVLIDE